MSILVCFRFSAFCIGGEAIFTKLGFLDWRNDSARFPEMSYNFNNAILVARLILLFLTSLDFQNGNTVQPFSPSLGC